MSFDPKRLVWRQLHWLRPLDIEQVRGLLRRLAADERSPVVVLEARSTDGGVSYLLGAPAGAIRELSTTVASLVPGTTVTEKTTKRYRVTTARELKLSSRHRALRTDDLVESSRQILSALQTTREGETIVVQIVLGARRIPLAVPTKTVASTTSPWWVAAWYGNGGQIDSEKRRALRDKLEDHGFACAVRIGVDAATPERRGRLALGIMSALRTTESAGLQVRHRSIGRQKLMQAKPGLLGWPLRLNIREVLALTGWPLGDTDLPGVPLHPRRLPPTKASTKAPIVIGDSLAPGFEGAAVGFDNKTSVHHVELLGPTGVGKSALMGRLVEQDIAAGKGVILVEPKGDLVEDVLSHIPEERRDDVVVLDPSDRLAVGLNPLHLAGRRPEVAVEALLAVLRDLFEDSWGPRTQDILHSGLLTLARHKDATLVMLPLLLTNAGFRRSLTSNLRDPYALDPFWAWYERLSDAERAHVIAPVMNKLRPWLLHPGLRAVLGQRRPKFDLLDVFSKKRILLVPLRKGRIGQEAAALLGSLVVSQAWQATEARSVVPVRSRHPVSIYIDEVQNYLHLPTDLGDALAQARGYGVGFTLAHQFMSQLTPDLRSGLLANARSRIVFQLAPEDAAIVAKGRPELTPADFMALGEFEAYASLYDGQVRPYALLRTRAPGKPISKPGELRRRSRDAYGQRLDDIEAGFAPESATPSQSPQTGRRRRS